MSKFTSRARYERLQHLLIEARHAAGLTQVELAVALSRPQSYVSKYERGARRLDLIEFLEVAGALKLDVAAFLEELRQSDEEVVDAN